MGKVVLANGGGLRKMILEGVGEINKIILYSSAGVWYESHQGWLENHEDLGPDFKTFGRFLQSDAIALEIEEPRRAKVANLEKADNFYLKDGKSPKNQPGYLLYIYCTPAEHKEIETNRCDQSVSYGDYFRVYLRNRVRYREEWAGYLVLIKPTRTVITDFGRKVEAFQDMLNLDGFKVSSSQVVKLLELYSIERKTGEVKNLLIVDGDQTETDQIHDQVELSDRQAVRLEDSHTIYESDKDRTPGERRFIINQNWLYSNRGNWKVKLFQEGNGIKV